MSVYVGELHKRASPLGPNPDPAAVQALEAEANRLGSRALFYSAMLTLTMNILLPFVVSETATIDRAEARTRSTCAERIQVHLRDLWTISHAIFAGCMLATLYIFFSIVCVSC
jgi:solute carrier family 45 protein 1/2/4